MKTISTLALISAFAAFLLVPLSFEISVSLLFAAGFTAIALTDYARTMRPLRVSAPIPVTTVRKEKFGLAA